MSPISDLQADELFAPLGRCSHVALAVSGGSDSMALLHLAARWAARSDNALRLSVLTVDHGLRAQSAEEAAVVGRRAGDLQLDHHVLRWQAPVSGSGLQAAAREARYRLMSQWCQQQEAQAIVTAHTANDQAETLLMRLARGSGVDGLAGMAPEAATPWPVMRPLLGSTLR